MGAVEWRDIPGWDGRYQVSNDGRIMSFQPGRLPKLRKIDVHKSGHHSVLLVNPRAKMLVHRAVAMVFIGPSPSEAHHCAHWDGDPANNSPLNLRWATPKENKEDGRRLGECPKLNLEKVAEIKSKKGKKSVRELAREYGVVSSHIWRIQNGEVWA